jgi:NAD-dependent SIR2 family protein deacetylase
VTYAFPVREAQPNIAHYALVALHRRGFVDKVITQNVDGLHARAGLPQDALLELHGTLFVSGSSSPTTQLINLLDCSMSARS